MIADLRDKADRDLKPPGHGVPKRWQKAATGAAGTRLGIGADPPVHAIERDDLAGRARLSFLSVVGGIRLTGNDEYFPHTKMIDGGFSQNSISGYSAQFQAMPASRWNLHGGGELFARNVADSGCQLPVLSGVTIRASSATP